jgi:hypothetical protein
MAKKADVLVYLSTISDDVDIVWDIFTVDDVMRHEESMGVELTQKQRENVIESMEGGQDAGFDIGLKMMEAYVWDELKDEVDVPSVFFVVTETGSSVEEAFKKAVDKAKHDHGHSGKTGTIAEKTYFLRYELDLDGNIIEEINLLQDDPDSWVNNVYGPAAYCGIGKNEYIFFGIAECN